MKENTMKCLLNNYIENDINFIKSTIDKKGYSLGVLEDLYYLENMTKESKEKIIQDLLNDDELIDTLNECLHHYLYERR